jgi:predicted dehydrogenase
MSGVRPVRAAVIGAGFIGPQHVDAIRRTGYAEVVTLVDVTPERSRTASACLGIESDLVSPEQVFAHPDVDVIHVCTPNATHVDFATRALEAGKHVVVEKPLSDRASEASALAALARDRGRHGMVTFTYRGYPMVRRARAMIAAGELGAPRLAHGSYLQDWLSEPTDYNWRLEAAHAGRSRAVADIGMHWFDTTEFVSGLAVEAVLADLATIIPERVRPIAATATFGGAAGDGDRVAITTEDVAMLLVRFQGGARGTVTVSQVSPGHKNDLEIEVAGSTASLRWRQESPERLWVGTRADSRTLVRGPGTQEAGVPDLPPGHPEGWGEALRDLFRPFYRAVSLGVPPQDLPTDTYPTLDAGRRAVAFVEAVLASHASGRWEPIAGA